MAKRKEKADGKRPFAFLHELSRHVIDRCNVISVHSMPKTKSVSQESGPEENRFIMEREKAPQPCSCVEATQETIKANHPIAEGAGNKDPKRIHRSCPISLARFFIWLRLRGSVSPGSPYARAVQRYATELASKNCNGNQSTFLQIQKVVIRVKLTPVHRRNLAPHYT